MSHQTAMRKPKRLSQALGQSSPVGAPHAAQPAVLITGSSSGIGAACALDLADHGFRVFGGVRSHAAATELRAKSGGRVTPVMLDVVELASIRDAVIEIGQEVGDAGLKGLINNAGVFFPGPLELMDQKQFRQMLEVNVLGTHAVTRECLPLLRRGRGRIVIMGSIAGLAAAPGFGAYSASKHALEAMADVLRMELRRWGISVSIIEPDGVATPIWSKVLKTAGEFEKEMPESTRRLYRQELWRMQDAARDTGIRGMPVERVVRAVRRCLSARRPKTRYPLGLRAWLAARFSKILPDRLCDRFLIRFVSGRQG
jgi:NAD(P)-dependent dehydrogenase (short-subunit alcohol dehydrogenase family)